MVRPTKRMEFQEMDMMRRLTLAHAALAVLILGEMVGDTDAQQMDEMWGKQVMSLKAADAERGQHIQNQQNSSHNYQTFPIGWINSPRAGQICGECLLSRGRPGGGQPQGDSLCPCFVKEFQFHGE